VSVPIVAARLAESITPLMQGMIESLECRTLCVSLDRDGHVAVYIHDEPGKCSQGVASRSETDRALMDANTARQALSEGFKGENA